MGKRLTIFGVMVIVAVVAIDLGAVRGVFAKSDINTNFIAMFILGTVPMANVLLAGLLAGHQRRRYPPFLRGFEASGATALVIYVAAIWRSSWTIERVFLRPLLQPLHDYLLSRPNTTPWEIIIGFIVILISGAAILALPQLAFASIGGFIFHKIGAQRTLVKELSRSSRP
jgi:hypothetical protein